MPKSLEQALRDEITRFLAQKGYRSPTAPITDLLMEWEYRQRPPEDAEPDVVKVVRRAGK